MHLTSSLRRQAECGMGTYTGGRRAPTHDEIAAFAYCLYESRGHHTEDRLRAETATRPPPRVAANTSEYHRNPSGLVQNERIVYVDHKADVDVGVSDVRHGGA
jgi:hypothetical protein